ncbi:MAG: class I SAM-dependent methyltransferase [Clostridiales bacterium]|nr:class I SAM-dependent methyltransferase [Clostridiales bacterium]
MKKHLVLVAESYDKGIEEGSKGINLYENLPDYITSHPDYTVYAKLQKEVGQDSKRKEVKDFLTPQVGMKLVDLGCCLNLMFNDYDKWDSKYYGIDISKKTIQLLENVIKSNGLEVGGVYLGSIHETPFEDNFFDIAACIGILEYFEEEFIGNAIREAHRIIKPKGRFVLDIPNLESPVFEVSKLIEEYIGRPDKFNLSVDEFNYIIKDYFEVERTEKVVGMIQYFLVKKD